MESLKNKIESPYDLVVIGGGINGAAIARDAALRGLKVALLEKSDFGSGASCKTSKLAHGGLRYLEQYQFQLVRESLRERALLLKNASHLVHLLPFILPSYKKDPQPLWKVHLGLFLYDYLGGKSLIPHHTRLNPDQIIKEYPSILASNLKGGCLYYDCQMSDNRIIIENIISAESSLAFIRNRALVTRLDFKKGKIHGVEYRDELTKKRGYLPCRSVVNATGAWSTEIANMSQENIPIKVHPSKGVHLVVPKIINEKALILLTPQDKRVFFILPYGKYSLIGATDTFYEGNPDSVSVNVEDVNYLLEAVNTYFPDLKLTHSSVLASFAGLRPLIEYKNEISKKKTASSVMREHKIYTTKEGVVTILWGKYTTYRLIAEEVVDAVIKYLKVKNVFLPCSTKEKKLPGCEGIHTTSELTKMLRSASLADSTVTYLLTTYGELSLEILNIINRDKKWKELLSENSPYIAAELAYSVQFEHLKTLEDWFFRRTSIAYTEGHGLDFVDKVASHLAYLLNWDIERQNNELASYRRFF